MTKFKVEWVENKSPDWKIATLSNSEGNQKENVSINRVNKKGEVFPNFEGITPGAEIDGEAWQSDSGKWYLFAPKAEKTYKTFQRKDMNAVMEKKAEHIAHAQDNKEQGIKVSSTMRMAVDIAAASGIEGKTPVDIQNSIKLWRTWLWSEWDKEDSDFPPFN